MDFDVSAIDLENVDYDDVLQMHRGWRRAETALKEATEELIALQIKTAQLQEGYIKFKSQIQSLESVKDFTIGLQSQLNLTRQENSHLTIENKRISETKSRTEKHLQEYEDAEHSRKKAVRDAQTESESIRVRYHEVAVSHKELENMLSNEVAMRESIENRLMTTDNTIDSLRTENSSLRLKLDSTLMRMSQCDQELSNAAIQISSLSEEVDIANEAREEMLTSEAEIGVLKGDISRLLRLMEHYPASREFLDRWYDSDGMSFMGMGAPRGVTGGFSSSSGGSDEGIEFDAFLENEDSGYITPGEVAQLKRLHGGDPFPMTSSFEDEAELWVPRKASQAGLQFLAQKIPHAPPRLITEFLRKINKVWLRREHRKFGDLKSFYDGRIGDLRRQLSNLKPYRGVIAENHIRRLKHQVREERGKAMTGRPRRPTETSKSDYFDENDDNVSFDPHVKALSGWRLCEHVLKKKGGGSVASVTKEKLLEASLLSLETMGRQRQSNASDYPQEDERTHPSDQYLRGALWLGRNLTMVIEELAEGLDFFRSKFLSEVTTAGSDLDLKRGKNRLTHLANTSINEALALTNRSRVRARDILQSVASISAGDLQSFQELLRTLPIESGLLSHTDRATSRSGSRGRSRSGSGGGGGGYRTRGGESEWEGIERMERRSNSRSHSRSNSRGRDREYRSPSRTRY